MIEINVDKFYSNRAYYPFIPGSIFQALENAYLSGKENKRFAMPRTIVKTSPISEAINRRFFVAIDMLVNLGKIDSLSHFCELHNLSAPRYREMRLGYGTTTKPGYQTRYKNLEVEALYTMVANYPISAHWLLTGRGEMMTDKK